MEPLLCAGAGAPGALRPREGTPVLTRRRHAAGPRWRGWGETRNERRLAGFPWEGGGSEQER